MVVLATKTDERSVDAVLEFSALERQAKRAAYLRLRYYHPDTGTFNKLDPFAGDYEDPQSLHKYAYAHGDPVNNIDPSGEFIGGLVGLLGAAGIRFALRNLDTTSKLAAAGKALATVGAFAAGYGGYSYALNKFLSSGPIWAIPGQLPTRADNVAVQLWIDNVATALKNHVDRTPGTTIAQRVSAKSAADKIADVYVKVVQARAQTYFKIQNSSGIDFGNNGNAAGWLGNLSGGPPCNCDNWANLIANSLSKLKLSGSGWQATAHWDTLKAGDVSLGLGGFGFSHNYISLTFNPNNLAGVSPSFALDPWQRSRPDVFDFDDFQALWPVSSARNEPIVSK